MAQPKYFDLIQCNPDDFNALQKQKRDEYVTQYGKDAYQNIKWSKKHHELKAHRSVDYTLTNEEFESLKTNGIYMKDSHETSFLKTYLDLYNNDMPVFITSDSMLYAVHKFYNNVLKKFESNKLLSDLQAICKYTLEELYTITPTEQNQSYLTQLEVFFTVPLVFMNLNRDLDGPFVETSTLLYTVDEINIMLKEKVKEPYVSIDYDKMHYFLKFIGTPIEGKWGASMHVETFMRNSKLRQALENFNIPHVDKPIEFKFGGRQLFNEIIEKVGQNTEIDFNLGDIIVRMPESGLKPVGHYAESLKLKQYYMAYSWFSKFNIVVDTMPSSVSVFKLYNIIAKIAEKHLESVNEFQNHINMILGEPISCTINSILKLINNYIPQCITLDETIDWILNNEYYIEECCNKYLINIKNLTTKYNGKPPFNLFGDCSQIDNNVILQFIDEKLIDDDGNRSTRKFPSIYDLTYTLFGNKSVKGKITNLMNNVVNSQRDGYVYHEQLEILSEVCDEYEFKNNIYDQELKMIRSLTTNKSDMFPFNTSHWDDKQTVAQIAHYAEIRHDNCLYVKKPSGGQSHCEHPDLLLEPVPLFWSEMLKLVNIIGKMVLPGEYAKLKSHNEVILETFKDILGTFIEYSNLYLSSEVISEEIINKLKSIVEEHRTSGGECYYEGWYSKLFDGVEKEMVVKPEVTSYFTGQNDERGLGGQVHLGTGPCKLIYMLVTDTVTKEQKIMLGPTYSAYEFITDYGTVLNDNDWVVEYKNYKSL